MPKTVTQVGPSVSGLAGAVLPKVTIVQPLDSSEYVPGPGIRTIDAKFGEIPSVLDFNARGDGTARDAFPINNAITAVNAAGGGFLHVPRGVYNLYDEYIVMQSGVHLIGDRGSTVIKGNGQQQAGRGLFDFSVVDSAGLYEITIDGGRVTPVQLLYSAFASNPLDVQLTKGTSTWIHPGSSNLKFNNVRYTHASGYSILADADSADVANIEIDDCNFENNRAHLFGTQVGDARYGSWTGGILYRGDCRTSQGKPFAVRGFFVRHCKFRRNLGNCVWGHSWGFDTQHNRVVIDNNYFEDCGLDAVLLGNVSGGSVRGNTAHRVGYTFLTDTDTPTPRYLPAADAVAFDCSGYVSGCTISNNVGINVNGEFVNLDGFRNGSVKGNQCMNNVSGEPGYTEDSVASFGTTAVPGNITRGITLGNTQGNGGGVNVDIVNNTLLNCGLSSIVVAAARGCRISNNKIVQPALVLSGEVPIQLFSQAGIGDEGLVHDNVIEGNSITFGGADWAIKETGAGWSTTLVNRVFNNYINGVLCKGEFMPAASGSSQLSGSFVGFSVATAAVTATGPSSNLIKRVGYGSGAALQFYTDISGTKTFVMQIADLGPLMNISQNAAAGTGALATGNIAALAFYDCVATQRVLANGLLIMRDTGTFDSAADALDGANKVHSQYVALRYNKTAGAVEVSYDTDGSSHRIWKSLVAGGVGTLPGSDKSVMYNALGVLGGDSFLAWDYTNKFLGIGTIAPHTTLELRKDVSGAIGPILTLTNGLGVAGSACAIDCHTAGFQSSGPTTRVATIDDGASSGHLAFYSRLPGSLSNSTRETMRLTSGGALYLGSSTGDGSGAQLYISGFISSHDGFYTQSGNASAIQAPTGGVVAMQAAFGASTVQFPGTVTLLAPTHSSGSKRASVVYPGWALLSDVNGNGTLDFALLQLSSSINVWRVDTTGASTFVKNLAINSITPSSTNGVQIQCTDNRTLRIQPSSSAASFNPMVKAEDTALIMAKNLADDAGGIFIGPWSASAFGLRISHTGFVYVNATIDDGTGARLQVNGAISSPVGFVTVNTAVNAIQAPSGGVTAKYLFTSESLFLSNPASTPPVGASGLAKLYFNSSTSQIMVSINGAAFTPLVSSGGALTAPGATTNVLYNLSNVISADANFTWNPSTRITTIAGKLIVTGSDPNGVGTEIQLRNTASTPINKFLRLDSAGNLFIANSANNVALFMIQDSGTVFMTGTFVVGSFSTDGSGAALQVTGFVSSSVGFFSPNTSNSTVNIPNGGSQCKFFNATGTVVNSIQSVSGGVSARNVNASAYMLVGRQTSDPTVATLTTNDTLQDGLIYYNTISGRFMGRANGTWAAFSQAAGGVTSLNTLTGAIQIVPGNGITVLSNAGNGTITIDTKQNISTTANVIFNAVTSQTAVQASNQGTQITFQNSNFNFQVDGNGNVSCTQQMSAGFFKKGSQLIVTTNSVWVGLGVLMQGACGAVGYNVYISAGGGAWNYHAGGTDTISAGGNTYGFEGGILTKFNGTPYNAFPITAPY